MRAGRCSGDGLNEPGAMLGVQAGHHRVASPTVRPKQTLMGRSAGSVSEDVHHAPASTGGELDASVGGSKQGVIASLADVFTRMEAGATLTNEDRSGSDDLAVEPLHAEALGLRVTSVAC